MEMETVLWIAMGIIAFVLVVSVITISKGYKYQAKADEIDERRPNKYDDEKNT